MLRRHGVSFHFYADDAKIYLSFNICTVTSALVQKDKCISDIGTLNGCKVFILYDGKTEVIVCGTMSMLSKLISMYVTIGDVTIQQVLEIKNISALFDSSLFS